MVLDSIKKFSVRWGPTLLVLGSIFYLSSLTMILQPSLAELPIKIMDTTLLKKGGHVLIYLFLALALHRGFKPKNWKRSAAILCFVLFIALIDEIHQGFVPGRNPSLIDVGIDMYGAALGIVSAHTIGYIKKL